MSGTTDRRPSLCWEIFRCVDCGHYYGMIAVDFEHDPNFRPVPLATTAHGARRHARASGPRRRGRDGRRPAERWRKAPGGASGRTFTCPALIGDPWPLAVAVVADLPATVAVALLSDGVPQVTAPAAVPAVARAPAVVT